MSIYLAATSTNPASTHPLFKQRGLDGLTHAAPNQLGIHGRPFLREVAYDGYYRNIDVFMAATNRKQKIPTYTEDAELVMRNIDDLIPMELPHLFFLPVKDLTADQQDSLMRKLLAREPMKKVQGKTTAFILQKPEIRDAMVYLTATKDGAIAPEGCWTPIMFASMSFLMTVITEFLKTNTYPAFLNAENRGEYDGGELIYETWDQFTTNASEYDQIKRLRGASGSMMGDEYKAAEDEDAAMEEDNACSLTFTMLRKAVFVAKPSPVPLAYNIGSPAEVPNLPGRVFPYFDKMNIPDNYTIRTIISSFFLRNLSDTRGSQMAAFKRFRPAWERLAKTKQGGVLVHMLMGVRLSLETQTRLFLVYRDNQYAGFVLLGALWSVTVDNRLYEWDSAEKVREQVDMMSSHEYAVKLICEQLSKCQLMIGQLEAPAVEVKREDVSSALKLWNKIKERKIEKDEEEAIKKVLGLVAYTRSYREVGADSLHWLFQSAADPIGHPIKDTDPLFLPPTFSLYQDTLFQLLCSFGPDAPSFYNTTGQVYALPAADKEDPNNAVTDKGEKAMPLILVSLKSVQVALSDLRKVLKDRAIRMNLAERAGRNRNITLRGENRDKVYTALKKCVDTLEAAGAKRKAEGEGSGKGKQKKTDINSADDLLSLF